MPWLYVSEGKKMFDFGQPPNCYFRFVFVNVLDITKTCNFNVILVMHRHFLCVGYEWRTVSFI